MNYSGLILSNQMDTVKSGFYFLETLHTHMQSFVKIEPSQNGETTLSFAVIDKLCPCHRFLMWQICLLMLLAKYNSRHVVRIYIFL